MKEVTIFGSCISRDIFNQERAGLKLRAYFARSSWISATSPTYPLPRVRSKLTSPFQQRMLDYDFKSAVLPQIEALEDQLLLIDLIDERGGVLQLSDAQYVTDLAELRHSGWRAAIKVEKKVDFGSSEHLELFKRAVPQFLGRTTHLDRVVIQSSFASHDSNNVLLEPFSNKTAEEWDSLYQPYFDTLKANGLPIITVPKELCIADANHQWGTAPYHYIPEFYDWISQKLLL